MSIKKMFVGEKMPDKNDPKYRERYEREVNYGRRFADKTGISWMARKLQQIADSHRCGFLVVVFGSVSSSTSTVWLAVTRPEQEEKAWQ